jgi:formate-dependent nitrite reductase membrane component NrfD
LFAQIGGWLAVELLLVGLLILGLVTGGGAQLHALELVMSGPYALVFWGVFVTVSLALPLLLDIG